MSHCTVFRNRVNQRSRLDIETAACASSNLGKSTAAFQRHSPLAGKQVNGESLYTAILLARCCAPQYELLRCSLVCRMPLQHAVLKCVAIGVAYVAPFYCRGSHARDYPSTIMFRMTSTVATSLLAWLPLYHQVYNKVQLLTGVLHVPFTRC